MLPQTAVNVSTQNSSADFIEALDLRRFNDRSSIKASCRVRINRIIISGVKVIVPTLASRPFVGMPSRKTGEAWEPLISILSPSLEQAVSAAVLAEWRKDGIK